MEKIIDTDIFDAIRAMDADEARELANWCAIHRAELITDDCFTL